MTALRISRLPFLTSYYRDSCCGRIFLVGTSRYDLQLIVRQRPLQRLGLISSLGARI
jgi:hypothetical protein